MRVWFKVLLAASAAESATAADALLAMRHRIDNMRPGEVGRGVREAFQGLPATQAKINTMVKKAYRRAGNMLNYVGFDESPPIVVADGPIVFHLTRKDRWLLRNVKFTEKAIWARPLGGQWHLELNRALVDLVTIGLFEISRSTAGNAYHWAFVARGKVPDGLVPGWQQEPYVYMVAQDRRVAENKEWKKHKRDMSRFTIHVFKDVNKAAMVMGCGKRKGFVKYPEQGYGKNPRLNLPQSWRKTKEPRSIEDMIELIKICPSTKRKYSLDKNNCQHFASYMFHDIGDRGRRVKINRKRPNPSCV